MNEIGGIDISRNQRFFQFVTLGVVFNTRFIMFSIKSIEIRCCEIISFLPKIMKSNKPQTENEAQSDETEELWNSGNLANNMLKIH